LIIRDQVKLNRIEKLAAIVKDHEADCFDSLVAEYAEMGFSRYAIARRLLGIDVRTMINNLSRPVVFQKAGHHEWQIGQRMRQLLGIRA